jgi:hypothetical protein
LVDILEGKKIKKNRSEGERILSVTMILPSGYEIEMYDLGKSGEKRTWLVITQLPYTNDLGEKLVGTSVQTYFPYFERVDALLIRKLLEKHKVEIKKGFSGSDKVVSFDQKDTQEGKISLPYIAVERKSRVIKRNRELLNASYVGLSMNTNFFRLCGPEYMFGYGSDIVAQTAFMHGLEKIFCSVGENGLGYMFQGRYSNNDKLDIVQAWDQERRQWHSHITGPRSIMNRFTNRVVFR